LQYSSAVPFAELRPAVVISLVVMPPSSQDRHRCHESSTKRSRCRDQSPHSPPIPWRAQRQGGCRASLVVGLRIVHLQTTARSPGGSRGGVQRPRLVLPRK